MTTKSTLKMWALGLCAGVLLAPTTHAQNVTTPRGSQMAEVKQTVGLTEVSVKYSRPAVNNRDIWGALVPYDQMWRAGANENTVISFSNDVTVHGGTLAAGSYGLHMIPGKEQWEIVFSKNHTSWGSFSYKQEEDALRIMVKPEATTFNEYLTFDFDAVSNNSTTISLKWEKVKIPLKIEVDVNNVVLANMKNELRSLPGFSWQGWNAAANYCLQNDFNLEEALTFSDQSIRRNRNFTNVITKSQLLDKLGRKDEAKTFKDGAMSVATMNELNTYGYQLLNQNKNEEAIAVFKMNTENNPENANVFDSLGEGYFLSGNKELAIESFKKSLSLNPAANVKANSEKYLKQMGVEISPE